MKIIRWPIICLALLVLLFGFFLIGYSGSGHLRSNLESFATDTFDSPVKVDDLQLNIYHSHIGAENISVSDPENRARYIFTAEKLNLQADLAAFFQKRIALNYVDVVKSTIRLLQKEDGTFDFISDKPSDATTTESTKIKINKIVTWTADKVNPVEILSNLSPSTPGDESSQTDSAPDGSGRSRSTDNSVSQSYTLKIPKKYPDITVDDITVRGSRFSLYPWKSYTPLLLHGINARGRNLSSRPTRTSKPLAFTVRSFLGEGTQSWTKVSGEVDVYKGVTNLAFRFELTNLNIVAWLPLARVYTEYVKMLDISSGILYLSGTIVIKDGIIAPTSLYIHVKDFTARASGQGLKIDSLQKLSVSEAEFDLTVPIDNQKPYIHFDTAIKEQNFRVKQMRNIEIRMNTDELKKEFLN